MLPSGYSGRSWNGEEATSRLSENPGDSLAGNQGIRCTLREGDILRLRKAAHKLCGMVAVFSSVAGGVASDLEDHAAQGQLDQAQELVGRLATMVDELVRLARGLTLEALRQWSAPAGDPMPVTIGK